MQTCIVHLIRHSLRYVPRREREQVARDLRPISTAVDADSALQAPARKLIYLAISNAAPAWTKTRSWTAALLAFKIHFGDRLPD